MDQTRKAARLRCAFLIYIGIQANAWPLRGESQRVGRGQIQLPVKPSSARYGEMFKSELSGSRLLFLLLLQLLISQIGNLGRENGNF